MSKVQSNVGATGGTRDEQTLAGAIGNLGTGDAQIHIGYRGRIVSQGRADGRIGHECNARASLIEPRPVIHRAGGGGIQIEHRGDVRGGKNTDDIGGDIITVIRIGVLRSQHTPVGEAGDGCLEHTGDSGHVERDGIAIEDDCHTRAGRLIDVGHPQKAGGRAGCIIRAGVRPPRRDELRDGWRSQVA